MEAARAQPHAFRSPSPRSGDERTAVDTAPREQELPGPAVLPAQGTGTAWPRSSARPAPAARGPVSKPRLTPRGTGRSKTPGEAAAWFRSFPCPLLLPSPPCPPAPSHGSVSQALPPGNLTSEAARPRHCFSHPTRRPPGSLALTFQTLGLTSLGPSVLLHRPWAFASMVPPPGMPLPTSRPRGRVPFERHPLCGTFVIILRAGRGEADRQSPTRGEAAWRNAGEGEAGEEHPRPLPRPHPAGLPPGQIQVEVGGQKACSRSGYRTGPRTGLVVGVANVE